MECTLVIAHMLNVKTLQEATHALARKAIPEMGKLANYLVINVNYLVINTNHRPSLLHELQTRIKILYYYSY